MSKPVNTITFRLAFRREGQMVNCYLARTETMEGAELLGSMDATILDACPPLWDGWRDLMTSWLRAGGASVGPPEVAPEHERAGRA